ncbi:hypothetical protein H0H81_007729 [Sphagnurus paluster]|uniref:Uncharacterized protein n=1 Tax=Sphagnurus paluster TaxID=117069 RepID=A0A9P7FWT6_9AGAR|nr:hypothetical protein H0H81_007729 [Sphagnurus paluster]
MLLKFIAVLTLASSVLSATTPTTAGDVTTSINSLVEFPGNPLYKPVSQEAARAMTNAKRLAVGLPLKPPTRRRVQASRAEPSGTPNYPTTGYLEARDANGMSIGYVLKAPNSFGQYLVMKANDPNSRLIVSLDKSDVEAGKVTNLQTVKCNTA